MVRLALAALLIVVLDRPAAAAPCGNCNAEAVLETSSGPPRATWIRWASTVNIGFTAADAAFLVTTHRSNSAVRGVQFVMTLPVILYGIDFVRKDTGDAAAWGLTLWSAGLFAHGFWPVIKSQLPDEIVPSAPVDLAPATLVGWDDQQARAGLSLSGSF